MLFFPLEVIENGTLLAMDHISIRKNIKTETSSYDSASPL